MAGNQAVGADGESIAARHLERLGYRILERNFRCALGEIDIVASMGEYLVFVEVKTRSADSPYHPTLAVTADKKRRVRELGRYYCAHHMEEPMQPRFDVVAVVLRPKNKPETGGRVEHFINAF